jgi:hypothetical protein
MDRNLSELKNRINLISISGGDIDTENRNPNRSINFEAVLK